MIFYDFEVFKHDWLVVCAEPDKNIETTITNDAEKLKSFYELHKNDIWCGFNSRHYDQYILKAILCGLNPFDVSTFIIDRDLPGWKFYEKLKKIKVNNYDVASNIDRGLKVFEGFLGDSIKESSVDFKLDRPLTEIELAEVEKYCKHDVEETIRVFIERKADFDAQVGLIKMFNLPVSAIGKTKAQLSAEILNAKAKKYNDEFDISFPDTLRLKKYIEVLNWYKNPENLTYEQRKVGKSGKILTRKTQLNISIAGVPHVFGWGGVHGAKENYHAKGYFVNMDVASLYPSLMLRYNLLSRSCNPQKFKDIVETRLRFKAEKNPMQAPLKIVINSTYGASKDATNPLFDPRQANNVCVYGQLLILDLIELLEPVSEIIQTNTDGVLVKMPDGQTEDDFFNVVDDISHEWERRTGLNLEFDEYVEIWQKDVNNYVICAKDGYVKSKGAYVKKLGPLDYDLPIVNTALINYLLHKTPIETTILKCNDLKEFQQVKKISKKYSALYHDNEKLQEKTVRIFASKNPASKGLFKQHAVTGRFAKVEGTPEHCFIFNDDVNEKMCPENLDKHWYVEVARKRLEAFLGGGV